MHHRMFCPLVENAYSDEGVKLPKMQCKTCPEKDGKGGSGGEKKKRRKMHDVFDKVAAFPEEDQSDADMKSFLKDQNTHVHERVYYSHSVGVDDLLTHVGTKEPAKLLFLNPGADKTLLPDNATTLARIRDLTRALVASGSLHASGTVVCALPAPVYEHAHRWAGAFKQAGTALEVEDHPMLVEFESRGGGRPGHKSDRRHLTGRVHQFLVAHQATTGDSIPSVRFTCNETVTADDVHGAESSSGPCLNLMKAVPFENALSPFPPRLLTMCINRFTNLQDTVVSTCGDRDKTIETALSLGRKVEVFPVDDRNVDEMRERVKDAFDIAWADGVFKREPDPAGGLRTISPGNLPDAVPRSSAPASVPTVVQDMMAEAGETGDEPSDKVLTLVASKLSSTLGYALVQDGYDSSYALYTIPKMKYAMNGPEIPIWGDMEIHLSPAEARESLRADPVDGAVRLIRVADSAQLKQMLVPGKEFVAPGATLYMRVAKTCPAYYARWESSDPFTHHEILSEVPRDKKKSDTHALWFDAEDNPKTPIKLRIYKGVTDTSEAQPVLVRPGGSAVYLHDGENSTSDIDGDDGGPLDKDDYYENSDDSGGNHKRLSAIDDDDASDGEEEAVFSD
ncbi:unnamed protein product [Ectocarpus sp. 12 AP-2014]